MNYRFLNVFRDILAFLLNYLVVVSIWGAFNAIIGLKDRALLMVLFALIPAVLYVVRINIGGFFIFTMIHILIPVAAINLLADSLGEKIIIGMVTISLSVISYVVSMKCDEPGEPVINPAFAGVLMFLSMLVISYVDDGRIVYIPKLALSFAAMYLPYLYIERFMWFDFMNSKTIKNIPTRESLKIGGPLVAAMSGFYFVAAFVCLDETLIAKMSRGLRDFLKRVIIWLLSFSRGGEEGTMEDYSSKQLIGGFEEGMLIEEEKAPSPFMQLLEKIFIYAVLIIAVAALIAGITYAVICLYRKFMGRQRKKKIKYCEDYEEVREKIAKKHKNEEKTEEDFEGPYAVRIRRLYKKLVRKNPSLTDKPEMLTAREFACLFSKERYEKAEGFALIYEKARYSGTECTKNDYNDARKYVSGLI